MYILMTNKAIKCSSFFFIFLGLFSKRNKRHFLREKGVETLACGSCSHSISRSTKLPVLFLYLHRNTENVFYFLNICHLIYDMFERTELRSRKKEICHIWSRGRHYSLFVLGREARCLESMQAQAESDRRVEIAGTIVKVQCSHYSSRGTVSRYTIYSGNAHAYIHLFHAICLGTKLK